MATIKKSIRDELDDITKQLVEIDSQQGILKLARKDLIDRFTILAGRHVERDGQSRHWPVSQAGMRVRVTETEATPTVNYDQFMRLIGPDVFARVCTVKTAAFDVEKWSAELEQETVRDGQLQECMGEPKPRTPSVYVEKIPRNGADS